MSHEYGWTTDYILSRTSEEINCRLEAIFERKEYDMARDCALKGIKYRPKIKRKLESLNSIELEKAMEKKLYGRL